MYHSFSHSFNTPNRLCFSTTLSNPSFDAESKTFYRLSFIQYNNLLYELIHIQKYTLNKMKKPRFVESIEDFGKLEFQFDKNKSSLILIVYLRHIIQLILVYLLLEYNLITHDKRLFLYLISNQ